MFVLALRQAETIRDLRKRNRSLAVSLRQANNTTDASLRLAQGWQSRAEALWLISSPDLRDGVVGALHDIDNLLEERT